ncbi:MULTISPECIES: nucleotidyltransferase family protein [Methanobacterium]|uniref:Molybdopterin-guanine dinucleotide biosynthesis protein MobA n=1 Tax=Methanobacterium bryantii TaxID=2161 RepID=A0A2A2H4Z7_METBR|nr:MULTISPECIES: NTP transferase domain-containing protein [Methanobacterium]OEC85640.1 molybdopterin-guanine dinucleotide biosynthesis protein MobA [Methanobacterium sp. A39]PAV04353.1 molybdopterin-guanine dinucleotide biosynthesis protein MobA [Methanobacterium bryantii]
MVSAIITAAGKNRRMREDFRSRGMEIRHKLLLDFRGNPIILQTLQNTLNAGVDECIVVLGHFSDEIISVLDEFDDERVKIVINHEINVELSESLLNGVKKAENDFCLCVAADQPTVSSETFKNIVMKIFNSPEPQNTVSILARGKSGYLDSAEGLGMPFACHTDILKKYLTGNKDNLNPILRKMVKNRIIFYGVPPRDDMELLNINKYNDYLKCRK